jgi:pSer/pThr/pTyr-binding forkhead associated (FHA) protein
VSEEFTLTLIKLGFLALLWIFVLSVVSVIRSDMFGARIEAQPSAKPVRSAKRERTAKPARQSRRKRGTPTELVITDGPNAGETVPLNGEPITLGRGNDVTLQLDDDYVSTQHARFVTNGEQWFVEDLGSTNGTYLGGTRVTRATPLASGTPVRLGKTVVELRR